MKNKEKFFPNLPNPLKGLGEIANNLWWSWHPGARMLFKRLDRKAWKESGHNPVKMLRELPEKILETALNDHEYLRHYNIVLTRFKNYKEEKFCWFLKKVTDLNNFSIAYFSSEYGLHHSLPFYAGGLGFLAGDFLKECSDLGVPLVAVGFMYPQGYVRQHIREDGWQENLAQPMDRDAASISKVLNNNGEELIVKVPLIDPPIYVSIWKIEVGRVPLYLMDTDIEENNPENRKILSHLYTSDIEKRLYQEIILGIGGSEVLNSLGINQSVLHLNEGHAAFALLERIRKKVQEGMSYKEASNYVKRTSIFTTHTPVPAGHDIFNFNLIEKYFKAYWPGLGLNRDSFLQLGKHPADPDTGFNMTAMAFKLSQYRNGVSKKHREVTLKMWQGLFMDEPRDRELIDYVTNGIHIPTWIEPKLQILLNKYLGPEWLEERDNPFIWELIDEMPDDELWQTHYWLKIKLIDTVRERSRRHWVKDKVSPNIILSGGALLDPSILTIGFARRFVTYKRADLIFYDLERLKRIMNDWWRPIQIIFAGKAHPADDPGKRIIQKVFNLARDPEMAGRIAFVENYDEQFAQYMVHGVDIWLNNPLPPMEACGTSGMKAALNGVPHFSIMDGWWIEGFNGKNGWAFGHEEVGEDRDKKDAEAIYQILEEKIIPLYYNVSGDGIPHGWVKVMKESIKSTASKFSARRMVKEYIEKFYTNALKNRGDKF